MSKCYIYFLELSYIVEYLSVQKKNCNISVITKASEL